MASNPCLGTDVRSEGSGPLPLPYSESCTQKGREATTLHQGALSHRSPGPSMSPEQLGWGSRAPAGLFSEEGGPRPRLPHQSVLWSLG